MENTELIGLLKKDWSIELNDTISLAEIHEQLAAYLNNLIRNDFEKMINLLYRIDVNEDQLKKLLRQNPSEDAGKIIATLIIERQNQKIKFRESLKKNDATNSEESW